MRWLLLLLAFFSLESTQVKHHKPPKICIDWIESSDRLPKVGDIVMFVEDNKLRIMLYKSKKSIDLISNSTHWALVQISIPKE